MCSWKGKGIVMCTYNNLKTLDNYCDLANKIRDRVCDELDKTINNPYSDNEYKIERIKKIIQIFRNFKYLDSKRFLKEV
jgi:uncharacterized protein YunC (DUF1805 family)